MVVDDLKSFDFLEVCSSNAGLVDLVDGEICKIEIIQLVNSLIFYGPSSRLKLFPVQLRSCPELFK